MSISHNNYGQRPNYQVRWHYTEEYMWIMQSPCWCTTGLLHEFPDAMWAKSCDQKFLNWWEILGKYEREHQTDGEYADLTGFDWRAFNDQGIDLAKQLKIRLGDEWHVEYASCILASWPHKILWSSRSAPEKEAT